MNIKEAIERLTTLQCYMAYGTEEDEKDAKALLTAIAVLKCTAPLVWIPCSERQPDGSGRYLTATRTGGYTILDWSVKYQAWNVVDDDLHTEYKMNRFVVAWAEIPAYEG